MMEEIILLHNKIKKRQMMLFGGCKFYTGIYTNTSIVLLKSGIGKTAAALGTTLLLQIYKPDIVINIGSAGSLIPTLKIGDIIISEEVSYHDVDITTFGYKLGQMASCPARFTADTKLIKQSELCVKECGFNAMRGLVISGDSFIKSSKQCLLKILINFPEAIAIEMEGAAIAQVCYKFKVPFIIIRSISDFANQKSYIDFNKFLTLAAIRSSLIIEKMLTII